uniref:Endonuclease V n=1 Tax=Phallusia mammillata TaxID=59560 RepID=A0A6F9DCM5_9ASCI|nr:endonuclease V [Phallusia mammillata]
MHKTVLMRLLSPCINWLKVYAQKTPNVMSSASISSASNTSILTEDQLFIWKTEQSKLQKQIDYKDDINLCDISRVAGLDISMHKDQSLNIVCVTLVVLDFQTLEVLYEDSVLEELTIPYKAGFLGFREVPLFQKRVKKLQKLPNLMAQIFLVDGNGQLHVRRCGSATHLGIVCDIPTIGVAKNLQCIEEDEISRDEEHKRKINQLDEPGKQFPIISGKGETIGMAVRTSIDGKNPVYISPGNKCSMETAVDIVTKCSRFRIPEPIRQADMRSRELLRKSYPGWYDN